MREGKYSRMRWIAIVVLAFLMTTSVGCQIVKDIATLPQTLEGSDNPTVRAASRIGQKILLKNARKHMKREERERFKKDPSYAYDQLDDRLNDIHDGNIFWGDLDRSSYSIDRTKEIVFDEPDRDGEPPVEVMGNSEILVDDEGSIRVDLPKLYEKWLGEWPFAKESEGCVTERPRYKFDADARLGFDSKAIVDKYKVEIGIAQYDSFTRKKEWRLSLELKYRSDRGDWAGYIQWEIPW